MHDCNNCKYLNVKECEQTKNKEPHKCLKYNEFLYHGGLWTRITPCNKCNPFIESLREMVIQ